MAEHVERVSEFTVIRSLKRLRDRYFPRRPVPPAAESKHCRAFWKVYLLTYSFKFSLIYPPLIFVFLELHVATGGACMPNLELLDAPLVDENESLDDREEGVATDCKADYMAEYLRGSPLCRQRWLPSLAPYKVVTSFLQSLVASEEPCYAMLGPGMEQLDVSFVTRLMNAPDVLPMTGMSYKQISGIGSGISYLFNNQHKFIILTLYSTNKAERERARAERREVENKLFTVEENAESGTRAYTPAPHMQQVCRAADGFIYVANAERDGGECEAAQVRAVLSSAWGATSRPLLVLSCVSREDREMLHRTVHPVTKRVPCVNVAKRLELTGLDNPWMVQDVVVESLSGLLDGISWLLRCSGVKLHYR